MESNMSKYKGTVTSGPRNKAIPYLVSFYVEFYREVKVSAKDEQEAAKLAEERIKQKQKGLVWQRYHLGDIELIDVKERL